MSSAQAELFYHGEPQTETTTQVNNAITLTPAIIQSTPKPISKSVPNGQEYYTIPNKKDDFEPLPMPEPEPYIAKDNPNTVQTSPLPNLKKPQKTAKNAKTTQKSSIPVQPIPTQEITPAPQPMATPKKPVKEKIVPMVKNANLRFASFPAKVYTGKRIAPKLATLKSLNSFYEEALKGAKGEKKFIQTLTNTKPNYAGHYVVTSFACGLNCNASVAYDVKTGDFMELGGGFADCPATDFNPRQKASITHQATSRLMIVIGATSSGSCMAGYFEEKNGNVNLISQKSLMTFVDSKQIDYRF